LIINRNNFLYKNTTI